MRQLPDVLSLLSKSDLQRVLIHTRLVWARYKLSLLTPAQLIIPVTFMQIIFFVFSIAVFSLPLWAIGNLALIALALIPMTMPRRAKYHWI